MSDHRSHISPEEQETAPNDVGPRSSSKHWFSIVLALVALVVFAISLNNPVRTAMRGFADILSPVLIGAVIAYLCDPILTFFEYRLFRGLKWKGLRRGLSLLFTVVVALGGLTLVALAIIPQFYQSLVKFAGNIEGYILNLQNWLDGILDRLPFEINTDSLMGWEPDTSPLQGLLDKVAPLFTEGDLPGKLLRLVMGLFNTFKNLLLGMIIAFYILASKEKRIAQLRKARAALFSEKLDRRITEIVSLANNTFGGFIYGKLLDSLVIGILTFVMLAIFNVSEYNLLIAIIVGITNIIPVFGPFIGAIPSFFIVLVSSPSRAILFLVLILIIQQLDGNVIGPKILGDNTGISSLCVIVAISICSALWGVMGMLIGVPIFAVIIELIRRILEERLAARHAPTDTLAYYPSDAIGNAEEEVYYEHSHLRYIYDHSKLKPVLIRIRTRLFAAPPKKKPSRPSPDDAPVSEEPIASEAESETPPADHVPADEPSSAGTSSETPPTE